MARSGRCSKEVYRHTSGIVGTRIALQSRVSFHHHVHFRIPLVTLTAYIELPPRPDGPSCLHALEFWLHAIICQTKTDHASWRKVSGRDERLWTAKSQHMRQRDPLQVGGHDIRTTRRPPHFGRGPAGKENTRAWVPSSPLLYPYPFAAPPRPKIPCLTCLCARSSNGMMDACR